jgi:hypothetical protein
MNGFLNFSFLITFLHLLPPPDRFRYLRHESGVRR